MKKILVVVDYQKDFVDGALGFEGAEKIEDEILKLIDEFQARGDFVVFTKDTHPADYLNYTEGEYLPVPHCIKGSEGWELTDRVKGKSEFKPIFEKYTFPSHELGNYIRGLAPLCDEVYLCGLVSDICVFANAIIAKAAIGPKGHIKVVKNATSSADLDMQEKSFEMLKHLHIDVIE